MSDRNNNKTNELKGFFSTSYPIILSAAAKTAIVFVLSSLYLKDAEFTFYIVSFILIIEVVTLFFQYSNFKKQQKQTAQLQRELENNKISWESQRDKEDFFAMWAHQIKTPIAALKLLLQSDKQDVTACKGEVFKIEHYVEMALGFLRFEEMGNDLELLSYELEPIVKQSIKKFAPMFISKHLSVNLKDLNVKILTDEKWLSFVIEQLLSNAVKYTSSGGITIRTCTENEQLCIITEDTGIGIRSEDLPRLFEKGFTGYNGRMDKKASGLGLYLCKSICDKLGHKISIESQENKDTKVTIRVTAENVSCGDLLKM